MDKARTFRGARPRGFRALIVTVCLLGIGTVMSVTATTFTVGHLVQASGPTSPFLPGCEITPQTGTNFLNAEVEPMVAVNPVHPNNIVGVWQQDRWSNGGAHGLVAGVSHNGGVTWRETFAHFSRCSGGDVANGGDYERASDPWVTFAPNGDVYQIAISFNDSNTTNAVLVSKSTDGGDTWSEPITLIRDAAPTTFFSDKESITADPTDANRVYAVWDRLQMASPQASASAAEHAAAFKGPVMFSRTRNAGTSWESPRVIFDPGQNAQTIGNQIVVLPNGDLVDIVDLISTSNAQGLRVFNVAVLRSTDHGDTWSGPIIVSKLLFVPVTDPNTGQMVRTGDIIPEIAVDHASGVLSVVWQDGRFNGFTFDDILFSMSSDGGFSWTPPIKINKTPTTIPPGNRQAFTPSVQVAADGTIGVTYYDFRNNTGGPGLPTDYWIVHCHFACTNPDNWTESHVAGSFNMEAAPVARGFFVGDYEGLAAVGDHGFLPFFVQAIPGTADDKTNVFATEAK